MPRILGLGAALPRRCVDNVELAPLLGRTPEEIHRRTGVRVRWYAAAGEGPSDLARTAAADALREAALDPSEVDLIVFATMTPDVTFPGAGCYLQDKLRCRTIGALDVRAQCTGFLFALEIADRCLRAGPERSVLVAAGEVHSSGLDFSARGADVTPLFGDGAAALVLGTGGEGQAEGVVGTVLHSEGADFDAFWCEFPSSRRLPTRFLPSDLEAGNHFPRIDEARVRRHGRAAIRTVVEEVLARTGTELGQVSRFVFHHLYPETAEEAARDLGVADRTAIEGAEGGHVGAASLPIALWRLRQRSEIASGDLVCLATAGSGLTSGAALIRL